jgi:uncharacterized protein YndB with AHSA1/START domain
MSSKPVVVEETVNAPVEKVWRAITDKNEMKQWYFDLDKFEPEVGFEFSFPGKGRKGETYIHLCKITEVIPNKKLQYSWSYQGYEGYSIVTFELFDEGDKTRVKLTHEGLDSFPKNNQDFAVASFTEGWTQIITKLLLEYVE